MKRRNIEKSKSPNAGERHALGERKQGSLPFDISTFGRFDFSLAGQFEVQVLDRGGRVLHRQVLKNMLNWDARDLVYQRMFTESAGPYPSLRYFLGLDNRWSGGQSQNPIHHLVSPDAGYPEDRMPALYNSEDYLGYFDETSFDTGYRRIELVPTIEQRFDMVAVSMSATFEAAISSDELDHWQWTALCDDPTECGEPWAEIDPYGSSKYGQNTRSKRNWESKAGFPWQQPTVHPQEAFGEGWDQWNNWTPVMNQDAWKSLWMPVGMVSVLAYQGTGPVSWPYTATYGNPDWKLLVSAPMRQPVRMVPGQRLNVNFKAYLGAD